MLPDSTANDKSKIKKEKQTMKKNKNLQPMELIRPLTLDMEYNPLQDSPEKIAASVVSPHCEPIGIIG